MTEALAAALLAAAVSVPASVALAQSGTLSLPDIADKKCQLGTDVSKSCDFFLPAATGAQGNVRYRVTHADDGINAPYNLYSFRRDTRKLTVHAKPHGQAKNGWRLLLVATDEKPASEIGEIFGIASKAFTVTFDGHPAVTLPTEDLNFTVGETVNERLQTSGNGDLTLSETTVAGWNAPASNRPADPEFDSVPGLTFGIDNNRASKTPHLAYTTISGMPTQPGEYEVTLKLTDGDGDSTTSSTFKIFVNAAPSFGGARVPNTVFVIGEEGEIDLPQFTPGNGKVSDHQLTLSHTSPWPSWLFDDIANPAAAKLIGTPPVGSDADAKIITVKVTDYKLNDHFGRNSDTISLCFSVGNGERCEVSFGDATVATQVYSVNTSIKPLELPEASRATGTARYSISGLPPGLVFHDASRTLSGVPTRFGSFTAKYTVTDEADSSASLTFDIDVNGAPSFAGARVANTVFAISEFGEIALPRVIPGNGTWAEHTTSWSPTLPPWLTFDDADRAALKLHGTAPNDDVGAVTYEFTVTDSPITGQTSGDSVTLSLCFSVGDGDPCPGVNFDDVTVPNQTYTKGRSIKPLTLPEARQGTGALTYSVDGLPGGLSFDPGTRQLSGTPSGAGADSLTYTVTYSVTDAAGANANLAFEITVNVPLSFGGEAPSGFDFTKDIDIGTITLPKARGGVGQPSYSNSGLPAGLLFDASGPAPTLSGTPTRAGTFTLVLKATDNNGASSALPIPVRVHPPVSFPKDFLTLGFPGPANTLPAARGGFGPLTYSLACATTSREGYESCTGLPPGFAFDDETRTLTGSFTARGGYLLELTATDRNDAADTVQIDLRVAGIVVKAYANKAAQDAGNALPDLTIRVPEASIEDPFGQDDVPRYTLNLAVAPAVGKNVKIKLSRSGDNDLGYYLTEQDPEFTYAGNNYNHVHTVVLFAAPDDGGENGTATIRHTMLESDDESYRNLTFDVTLVEVDNDPSVELSLDPASLGEDDGETEVTVTATVVPPAGDLTLTSFTKDTLIALGRAGGTATNPADYTVEAPSPFAITIPANESAATTTFKLTPNPDDLYEVPDETVVVTGTGTDADTGTKWSAASATLTIRDNDKPSLSADCGSRAVREGGGGQTMHVICTVTLRDANGNPVTTGQPTTFRYRTVAGTATAGEDYEDKEGEVTIPAGQSSASFALAVYDDDEQEGTERFIVEFFASPPFDSIPVTIYDDDSPAPPRPTEEEDEEEVSGPDDAYRATVSFGAAAYAAIEGSQAATVTVRLHPAPPDSLSVSIPVAGRGGRGVTPDDWRILVDETAGDTWNAATGASSMVFAPGEAERTFALEAVDDDDFEGNETLTLTFDAARLPEGVTADPEAAEAVVTLVDDDFQAYRGRVLKHVLAAFGRTVASDAVTLLTGRMGDDAPGAGSRASLAGQTLRLDGASPGTATLAEAGPAERGVAVLPDALEPWRTPGTDRRTQAITARELLTSSSFRYRLGAAEGDGLGFGGAWTLWGEGGAASFAGRPETDFSLDGEATSGWLGVDWRRKPAVVGISMSHYRGDVGYETGVADGDVELDLTSVFPYARWSLAEMDLWGVAGLGAGRLELTDSFGGNQSDMTMQMAAAGARRTVRPAGERGISLAAKADAFAVRLASEARGLGTQAVGDDLPAVNARAGRLRVALEAGYVHTLASGAVLRPTVDLGARLDSGDADSGAGVDLAGGVRYESPSGRLTLEGRGRVLLAHAASGFQEWAAGGLVRLAPEAGGRGLSLSIAPSWGMATSRTGALWDGDLPGAQGEAGARVATEIGYGLPAFKGHGLLTPWAGTELAQDRERAWRAGMRLQLRSDLALKLQGSHRENRDGEREQEIGMRLSIGF
ncbi:MAG: putative Ig domain-containing protein [Rhodospirillales bacterium]|nr:putative Ig domain-containing protein [Rhodospirillales bacterium]